MPDGVVANPGSGGATFATDENVVRGWQVPISKIELGADNTFEGYVGSQLPMPCNPTKILGNPIDVGAGNVGSGTQRVILASDQPVITVTQEDAVKPDFDTGPGVFPHIAFGIVLPGPGGPVIGGTAFDPIRVGQIDVGVLNYDTGIGAVDQVVMGIALPGAGGPVAGGTASNPIRTDPTGTTTQPVSGTVTVVGAVTANAGTGTFTVDQTEAASIDYDTGAGTVLQTVMGIALPGSGGPVAGGTASDPIRTDPTGTTTQPVSLQAGNNNVGDVDIASIVPVTASGTLTATNQTVVIDVGGYGSVGIQLSGTWAGFMNFEGTVDGSNWFAIQAVPLNSNSTATFSFSTNGIWLANVGGLDKVRVRDFSHTSGTVQVNLQANVASGKGQPAVGDIAVGVNDSFTSNPVKIGAVARNAESAVVSNGDRAQLNTDRASKLLVRPHCVPETQVDGVASTTSTSNEQVIAAQGAGVRIYVTSISVANDSTTTVIVEIKSGNTVRWRTVAPSEGGSNITFDPPLGLAANEALNMASLSAATTIYFSANGYKGV